MFDGRGNLTQEALTETQAMDTCLWAPLEALTEIQATTRIFGHLEKHSPKPKPPDTSLLTPRLTPLPASNLFLFVRK
jgi:hypothetical protein